MDYDPTSDKECKEALAEIDALVGTKDEADRWGQLNNFACDCYFEGELEIMKKGPRHLGTNKLFTKEEALAWVEKVYEDKNQEPISDDLFKSIGLEPLCMNGLKIR
ncbi:MAG: hypothetical protein JRG69_01840 [Deltaproteobacteria bacterium]|nr:hypothetical protein [Deltaproteobacteria bacterium]